MSCHLIPGSHFLGSKCNTALNQCPQMSVSSLNFSTLITNFQIYHVKVNNEFVIAALFPSNEQTKLTSFWFWLKGATYGFVFGVLSCSRWKSCVWRARRIRHTRRKDHVVWARGPIFTVLKAIRSVALDWRAWGLELTKATSKLLWMLRLVLKKASQCYNVL